MSSSTIRAFNGRSTERRIHRGGNRRCNKVSTTCSLPVLPWHTSYRTSSETEVGDLGLGSHSASGVLLHKLEDSFILLILLTSKSVYCIGFCLMRSSAKSVWHPIHFIRIFVYSEKSGFQTASP